VISYPLRFYFDFLIVSQHSLKRPCYMHTFIYTDITLKDRTSTGKKSFRGYVFRTHGIRSS
jgi:hypothetical protein